MQKPKRKFSRFQVSEPDCKAIFGGLVITVFGLESSKPKIEYNKSKKDVPIEIKQAVKVWVAHKKYAGIPLTDYLNSMFKASDYETS